jgi:hypothetical protein
MPANDPKIDRWESQYIRHYNFCGMPGLVEQVAEKRLARTLEEFHRVFPHARADFYMDKEGRGIIKVLDGRYIVGLEFIETSESWASSKRILEYQTALMNKCRLVVLAPKESAMSARMRMLELNQQWLFYYQVYSYDEEVRMERIGRPRVMPETSTYPAAQPMGGYL